MTSKKDTPIRGDRPFPHNGDYPSIPSMSVVAQLIDKKTGQRTPPITKTRREFADVLRQLYPANQADNAYVLILADDSMSPGSLDFALAPLMTVATFVEHFASKNDLGE